MHKRLNVFLKGCPVEKQMERVTQNSKRLSVAVQELLDEARHALGERMAPDVTRPVNERRHNHLRRII